MQTDKLKPFGLSLKVIISNPQGQCLILRRSTTSKNNAGKWDFPGGKMEAGELFDQALYREVHEETGLSIELSRPFTTTMSELPDFRVVYLIMLASVVSDAVRLSDEHDRHQWVSPAVLPEQDFVPSLYETACCYAHSTIKQD